MVYNDAIANGSIFYIQVKLQSIKNQYNKIIQIDLLGWNFAHLLLRTFVSSWIRYSLNKNGLKFCNNFKFKWWHLHKNLTTKKMTDFTVLYISA